MRSLPASSACSTTKSCAPPTSLRARSVPGNSPGPIPPLNCCAFWKACSIVPLQFNCALPSGGAMRVLETERLVLRRLTLDDAEFIFRLVNEPAWLRYIGDKHVRNLDDARNYLRTGPLDMYERFGFGMFLCELKSTGEAVGS